MTRFFFPIGALLILLISPDLSRGGEFPELPGLSVSSNRVITLQLEPPSGFHLNPAAPNQLSLRSSEGKTIRSWNAKSLKPMKVTLGKMMSGSGEFILEGHLYFCTSQDHPICLSEKRRQTLRSSSDEKNSLVKWIFSAPTVPSH